MFDNHLRTAWATVNLQAISIVVVMVMTAVFVGLVASTANLFLVVMLVGLMVGIPLLAAPRVSVWMILALGMTSGFVISTLGSAFSKLAWCVTLLSMLLVLPFIMKLLAGAKGIPAFIWLALIFILYAIMAAVLQWSPIGEFIAGFKRYFQMYGLMFALALLDFKAEDHRRWLKFMLVIALLQLPFALYERIVLVPMRGGRFMHPGTEAEATDVVAGTFGANLEGGSSNAEMAAFLIMAAAFVLARWRAGLVSTSVASSLSVVFLLPLFLGETKIVLVMLPLMWLVLMRKEFAKMPVRYFFQLLGLLLLTCALGLVYISMNKGGADEVLSQTLNYNVGTQGYGSSKLNRTTVFSFWWDNQSWQDPLGLLIGNGLGSTYFNPHAPMPGHLGLKYFGYGIGLTTASSLLWDTGLLGLILFLSILLSAWFTAGRLWTRVTDPAVRADALAIQTCIAIFTLFVFDDSALVNFLPFEVIAASILGYLGYLVRAHMPKQRAMIGTGTP